MKNSFFGSLGEGLSAEDSAELRSMLEGLDSNMLGHTPELREGYCVVHYIRTLERHRLIEFPFKISKRESPDFEIEMGSRRIGLEHTDAGSQQYRKAAAYFLGKAPLESQLEGHKVTKAGEPSQDRGYIGDEPERWWTEDVLEAIKMKSAMLPGYEAFPDYELLIYDDGEHSAETQWTVSELPARLAAAVRKWRATEAPVGRQFSRISVLRTRVLIYDVTGSASLLPVPPSPDLPPLLPLTRLGVAEEDLHAFCRQHRIRKLGFFGSIRGQHFGPNSDVDVLVEFEPDYRIGLIGLAGVELELSRLLNRKADLRTVPDLSRYFREEVVREKSVLAYAYAAG